MRDNVCCFFGHRKIEITNELRKKLYNIIENLILEECVGTFLFGSNSQFNDLCYQIICELREKYSFIKRIYVRAEFPYIKDDYRAYLLQKYEETYYPDNILKAGRSVYVKRNCEMINKSRFCIIYFNKNYSLPAQKKSGTKIAYDYANKKQRRIINLFDEINHT